MRVVAERGSRSGFAGTQRAKGLACPQDIRLREGERQTENYQCDASPLRPFKVTLGKSDLRCRSPNYMKFFL